jgi:thiamine-phosphate pyrophosphorylase
MDYSRVVAVTDRHLCYGDFYGQLRKLAGLGVAEIIVREKDLGEEEYTRLFEGCVKACSGLGVTLVPHSHVSCAIAFGTGIVHLPLGSLSKLAESGQGIPRGLTVGASVHSVEQARLAAMLGASYVTAGHIFATDCKKGLEPRGITFLENVCASVDIPVYAIGGISSDNYMEALDAGAQRVCMMSALMRI